MGFNPNWNLLMASNASIQADKTLAHRISHSVNISAPRLMQRIPPNYLPGTTNLYGVSNLPKRKPGPKHAPLITGTTWYLDLGDRKL